jgi:asparagine synthase (glutamine-hydrolysing)
MLREHLERKVDHGNRLWLLCNSEIWYRMKIEDETKEDIKERLKENSLQEKSYAAG